MEAIMSVMPVNLEPSRELRQVSNAQSFKPAILIVEDETGPREALKMILGPFFNIYAVDNTEVAMQVLREQSIDLVTLDLKLPGQQGMSLLEDIRRTRDDVEVVIITGYGSLQSAMEGMRYGAAAYLLKPFNVTELVEVVNKTLEKKRRFDCLREAFRNCMQMWGTELDAKAIWRNFSDLLEAKDRELVRHSNRVNFYVSLMAEHLDLSDADREALTIGACLHDVGKSGVDERSRSKSAGQREREDEIMKCHTEIGERMALSLLLPPEVAQIIRHHHECYDGSGYPDGLRGDEIPYIVRIVCIANEFDRLLTGRPDQDLFVHEDAREYIRRQAGVRFDPNLARLFAQIVR
jgi:putative two-component system response regulator